jgi:hypothetical protein
MYYSFVFILLLLLYPSRADTGYPGFDVFTSSAQLGLGGAGFLNPSSISSKMNPASTNKDRMFTTSIIQYPASITSQSAGLSLPWMNGTGLASIRHISYGTFHGYNDDAQPTKTYKSGDIWLQGAYSRPLVDIPLQFGIKTQFYSSSLEDYSIKVLEFSVGGIVYFEKAKGTLGLSIHQIGKGFSSNAVGILSPKTVLSGSKKLTHLPLTLFIDALPSRMISEAELFIGGIFKVNNVMQIRWGTSTRKGDHNIQQGLLQSILGASGFGVSYATGPTLIHYSTYIYGTGVVIQGLEIGIKLL